MKALTKQVQIFMTPRDEETFSAALAEARPLATFVDDSSWPTRTPPVKGSIHLCESRHVYLWDRGVVPELPTVPGFDGRVAGPSSGPVIQFSRSILKEDLLLSGRVAAGIYHHNPLFAEMNAFIKTVWRVLKKLTSPDLVAVAQFSGEVINPRVRGYLVGPDAVAWCRADAARLLKDHSTENYYLPAPP